MKIELLKTCFFSTINTMVLEAEEQINFIAKKSSYLKLATRGDYTFQHNVQGSQA